MGIHKKHVPGCSCCGLRCRWALDDFNRTTGTDISAAWTETAGSWEIASGGTSNVLRCTSANGQATYATDHPSGICSHFVRVKCKADADGDKAQVIVGYGTGAHLTVELEFGGADGEGTLTLMHTAGVVVHTTPIRGVPFGEWATITACYQDPGSVTGGGTLWGTVNRVDYSVSPPIPYSRTVAETVNDTSGLRVALGTGGVCTGMEFDDFEWADVKIPNDAATAECPVCGGCQIWETYAETNGEFDDTDCEQTITGTPFATGNTSAWSIASLVPSSQYDYANGLGVNLTMSANTTANITLVVGNYTAEFTYVSATSWLVEVTGTGISESEYVALPIGGSTRLFSLLVFDNFVCASLSDAGSVSGFGTALENNYCSASADTGTVDHFEFTRCPRCAVLCGCGEHMPAEFLVEIEGVVNTSPANCGTCTNINAAHVVQYVDQFQEYISGVLYNTCRYRSTTGVDLGVWPCLGYLVQLRVSRPASGANAIHLHVFVTKSSGAGEGQWSTDLTGASFSAWDCNDATDVELTKRTALGADCDWAASLSKCFVSSV